MKTWVAVFLLLAYGASSAKQSLKSAFLRKFGSILLSGSLIMSPANVIAETSLTEQLKGLQSAQISTTKVRVEKEESDAISRALQYPDGYLVGRGLVSLVPDDGNAGPYGVPEGYLVNPELGKDDATLFILAVGREGPPLAAKKIPYLNRLKFPLVVEVTCEDLLFPYTSSAWQSNSNRLDTIALTAIVSPDGKLSTANLSDRVAFGTSEPTNIAGVTTRTTAELVANKKIDLSMYSKEEIDLLVGIDADLDRKASSPKK